jgi:hypothetical protein
MTTALTVYRIAFRAAFVATGLWLAGAIVVAAALHRSGFRA